MPNVSHRWTPEEEEAALKFENYEDFKSLFPGISKTAHRIRRQVLLRPSTEAQILHAELVERMPTSCKLCAFLRTLSPTYQQAWVSELALPASKISHLAVVAALKDRGVDIEESSVRRHRRNHG